MISERRGGTKKENDIAKGERKIGEFSPSQNFLLRQ